MTRGHGHDQEALYHLAPTPAAYVGLIGSRRKIRLIFESLREQGIAEADLARVAAPVGLDIGSQTVPEIAISIVAELIARRNLGPTVLAHRDAGRLLPEDRSRGPSRSTARARSSPRRDRDRGDRACRRLERADGAAQASAADRRPDTPRRVVAALREGGADRTVVVVPPKLEPEGPALAAEAMRLGPNAVVRRRAARRHARLDRACDPTVSWTGEAPRACPARPRRQPRARRLHWSRGSIERARLAPASIVIPTRGGRRGHPIAFPWPIAREIPTCRRMSASTPW